MHFVKGIWIRMSNEKFVLVKICFYLEGKSVVKPIAILSR